MMDGSYTVIFVMVISPISDLTRNTVSKYGQSLISTEIHGYSKLTLEMYNAMSPLAFSQQLDAMRERFAMSIKSGSCNQISVRTIVSAVPVF